MNNVQIMFDIGIKKDIIKKTLFNTENEKKSMFYKKYIYIVPVVVILFHFMSTAQNIRFLYQQN